MCRPKLRNKRKEGFLAKKDGPELLATCTKEMTLERGQFLWPILFSFARSETTNVDCALQNAPLLPPPPTFKALSPEGNPVQDTK